jgi:uroporphyrinogen-III synthase
MPYSRAEGALAGVRVALLEARMGAEMTELLLRHGATIRSVAAVREEPVECTGPIADFLERLEHSGRHLVVFLTGVGAAALFKEAERQGRLAFLLAGLNEAMVVCRGPKPASVVRRYGVTIDRPVAQPYTTDDVLSALEPVQLEGMEVTLVHYGERNTRLAEAFSGRKVVLNELCLYEWRLPDDLGPLRGLVRDVLAQQFDAVLFTSQVQWRHLLAVADEMQLRGQLVRALNKELVVAAIGPVCQAALEEVGVAPHVVPSVPKMGPLILALAAHFRE